MRSARKPAKSSAWKKVDTNGYGKTPRDRSSAEVLKASLERHIGEPRSGENVVEWLARTMTESHALAGEEAARAMQAADARWKELLANGPPARAEYEAFMTTIYVPAYNAYYRSSKKIMCVECFKLMGLADGRADDAIYHDETCSARARQRGREKVNGGKSPEERARLRGKKETARHLESHKNCPGMRGEPCNTLEQILRGQLAIEQSRPCLEQYRKHTEST